MGELEATRCKSRPLTVYVVITARLHAILQLDSVIYSNTTPRSTEQLDRLISRAQGTDTDSDLVCTSNIPLPGSYIALRRPAFLSQALESFTHSACLLAGGKPYFSDMVTNMQY